MLKEWRMIILAKKVNESEMQGPHKGWMNDVRKVKVKVANEW